MTTPDPWHIPGEEHFRRPSPAAQAAEDEASRYYSLADHEQRLADDREHLYGDEEARIRADEDDYQRWLDRDDRRAS